MGLDGVELVMELEDRFGISIPDDDAFQMRTPGDIFDFIRSKTSYTGNSTTCLLAATFYQIRRGASALGVDAKITPRSDTELLLPQSDRRAFWQELQQQSGLTLPDLVRPTLVIAAITTTTLASSLAVGFALWNWTPNLVAALVVTVVAAIAFGYLFHILTLPLAIIVEANISTIRCLTESTLSLNFKALLERHSAANEADLWIVLRGIISEQLGVPSEQITPTVDLVRDLGLD